LTKTVGELVGSDWWMPPWAYKYTRITIDNVNPSFDVYPLAKILWSMISGRDGFPREDYDEDENNLEKIFPADPLMGLVNSLLAQCVVRHERDCIGSAKDLRSRVDMLIARIKDRTAYRSDDAQTWPCRVCGKGSYQNGGLNHHVRGYRASDPVASQEIVIDVYVCDRCGHADLFVPKRVS
jgi:hypothetical protein